MAKKKVEGIGSSTTIDILSDVMTDRKRHDRQPLQAVLLAEDWQSQSSTLFDSNGHDDQYATTVVAAAAALQRYTYRPSVFDRPKVLSPLVNQSLIDYTIHCLCDQGVRELYVLCVTEDVEKYITRLSLEQRFTAMNFFVIRDTNIRNDVDALREMDKRNVIHSEPFILLYGNCMANVDLTMLLKHVGSTNLMNDGSNLSPKLTFMDNLMPGVRCHESTESATSFTTDRSSLLSEKSVNSEQNLETDWVSAGTSKNDSDSETDEEELTQWAIKMLGIPKRIVRPREYFDVVPEQKRTIEGSEMKCDQLWECSGYSNGVPMSISEKVKLARRNRATSVSYATTSSPKKQTKVVPRSNPKDIVAYIEAENEADAKLKKVQARPLTAAEIKSILGNDSQGIESSSWVRRSVRQPSKSSLTAPRVKELLEKLLSNDSDMVVLKMKKYCSDLDTPSIVIDAVLDALEENTNCEALYIQVCVCCCCYRSKCVVSFSAIASSRFDLNIVQNFNEGMRDEQVLHLLRVLQRPSSKIWCLNIGETYKVQMKTWEKFVKGLSDTNISHMYASEHTITAELKEQIRETIRLNRKKHNRHDDPSNLDTIVQCTHCWWNPINAKSLRPYIQRKGYEHIFSDAEAQGLPGTMSGAFLT
jgi:hypothetical protein